MGQDELGPWAPLEVAEVAELLSAAPFRWWVAGGRALELHLGRTWREHGDIDVGVVRADAPALPGLLAGWEVHVAADGRLRPYDGEELRPERHEGNLWCRRPGGPWQIDVLVGEGTADRWVYKRDAAVTAPWPQVVLRTDDGVPYLAPELQLLFKSRRLRPKDDLDAAEVVPRLDDERRARLASLLPAGHPWQRLVPGVAPR